MENKYYNDAVIGNEKIVASFSKKGEMLRLFYPTRDYKQFIDTMHLGVKINDSALIYLHEDINNQYDQYYTEKTNILNTKIKNTYFNLSIVQTDFVSISKDVIIKKFLFKNENTIDLNINFLVYSKLLSNYNNMVSGKVENNIFMQYSHDYTLSIFSKTPVMSYRLNNSKEEIKSGILYDKDYIGMACDSAISFDVGNIKPGETKELEIFISINDNKEKYKIDEIYENIEKFRKIDVDKELQETKKYWENYVKKHDGLNIFRDEVKWQKLITGREETNEYTYKKYLDMKKIYERTILLFPLLSNSKTGGVSAAIEIDEQLSKCGRYSYCWPRDAVFITKALDILKMYEDTTKFYNIFAKETQSKNGMWEQRFYTDGRLAPCWGYQIDETASIVYGIYEHYKRTNDNKFLEETFDMVKKAIVFLEKYIDYICEKYNSNNSNNLNNSSETEITNKEINYIFERNESYDLWEMNEGIHLYSNAAIFAAFNAIECIQNELKKEEIKDNEIDIYKNKIKQICEKEFLDINTNSYRRNNKDSKSDISILGAVVPFKMYEADKKEIINTIEKMNLTIRTYTGGYIRFDEDNYIGGNNPWIIATLWMALYKMELGKKDEVLKLIDFVIETSSEHGMLAEQIDNETLKSKWVIGLGWSHAMFILALEKLLNL